MIVAAKCVNQVAEEPKSYRNLQMDVMGGPIEDWGDLFRPQLKGQVAMLGSPQEVRRGTSNLSISAFRVLKSFKVVPIDSAVKENILEASCQTAESPAG